MTFRELYDAHFAFVWRTLRRLGVPESDVADAAQEVFLVVHRRLGEFEGRARITTWLFRICFRVTRDRARRAHLRRELREPELIDACLDASAPADHALQRREDLCLLEAGLDALDLEQRAVFTLFELEEMTGEAISEALGIPLGTVYSRLRLARTAFRKTMKRELSRRRSKHAVSGEP
jgi:RNA polymerase sigma-70 factor (ECF subfamily)